MPLRNRRGLINFNCFFITTTCYKWLNLLKNDGYYQLLYESIIFLNKKYKAQIIGYVFMKNHIHFIIFFEKNNSLSEYMRDLKKYTSGELRRMLEKEKHIELLNQIRYNLRKQKFKVWMDRFDDVIIKSSKVFFTKLQYIHYNPVREGLVQKPEDYKHSSASYYFKETEPLMPLLHYSEIIS